MGGQRLVSELFNVCKSTQVVNANLNGLLNAVKLTEIQIRNTKTSPRFNQ